MAVLKISTSVVVLLASASCYSPDLRDCVVSCASAADCAGGQLCGADHLCASPVRAGRCLVPPDGGGLVDAAPLDAPPRDAPRPPPDAPPDTGPTEITLHVHLDGPGTVTIDSGGSCDSDPPQHGDCMLSVPADTLATLHAIPHSDQMFDRWTSVICSGQPATCTFLPLAPGDVTAKFRKEDH